MTAKFRKTIIYLLLLSMVMTPAAMAFASMPSVIAPLEITVDSDADLMIQAEMHHEITRHSPSHDLDKHVARTSDHCDTNKANCSQCDNCSHCINIAASSFLKPVPSIHQHINSSYSDLYRSVDQTLLLRPPNHA